MVKKVRTIVMASTLYPVFVVVSYLFGLGIARAISSSMVTILLMFTYLLIIAGRYVLIQKLNSIKIPDTVRSKCEKELAELYFASIIGLILLFIAQQINNIFITALQLTIFFTTTINLISINYLIKPSKQTKQQETRPEQ